VSPEAEQSNSALQRSQVTRFGGMAPVGYRFATPRKYYHYMWWHIPIMRQRMVYGPVRAG